MFKRRQKRRLSGFCWIWKTGCQGMA